MFLDFPVVLPRKPRPQNYVILKTKSNRQFCVMKSGLLGQIGFCFEKSGACWCLKQALQELSAGLSVAACANVFCGNALIQIQKPILFPVLCQMFCIVVV